jgi:sec-independent protein translocase protein TatA
MRPSERLSRIPPYLQPSGGGQALPQGPLPVDRHVLSSRSMGIDNPVHILFLAAVALVVLGPKRLPELARAAGKSMREFREALNGGVVEEEPAVAQLAESEQEPE